MLCCGLTGQTSRITRATIRSIATSERTTTAPNRVHALVKFEVSGHRDAAPHMVTVDLEQLADDLRS